MPEPKLTVPTYRFRGHVAPPKDPRGVRQQADVVSAEGGIATMRLYDPIDSWGGEWGVSAKEVVTALDSLPDDTTEIRLHINSPGGEVFEGIAMLNALRNHRASVTAVVDGLAASAASFIAAGADRVIMGRNSQMMIHDPWGMAIGNAADMRELADLLDHMGDNLASVYFAKAGGDVATWRDAMLAETWYSADEAVAAGLADEVEGGTPAAPIPTDDETAAKAGFDLSAFRFKGRDAAPDPAAPSPAAGSDALPDELALGIAALVAAQERRHRMNERKSRR